MVAAVETMAYAASGGVPWHRSGTPVSDDMTVEQMLQAAGLDWTVSTRPMYFPMDMSNPGDTLRIEMTMVKRKATVAKMAGRVTVDGRLVAEAEVLCKLADKTEGTGAAAS